MSVERPTLTLVHPVYLDVPMMVSFVAAFEDGFAFSSEQTEKGEATTDRTREASTRGRLGFPTLGALIGLDMSGRYGRAEQEQESRETKVVRQHTEASMFNILRHELIVQDQLTVIDDTRKFAEQEIGALVEIAGEVIGNPLQQLLDLFAQLAPYLGYDVETLMKPKKRKDPARSGNPAKASGAAQPADVFSTEDLFRFLTTMREDLERSATRDLVLLGRDGLRAVLALSTEFLTAAVAERLVGGRFTVMGKVTRVLVNDEVINLTRRTALGLAGPQFSRDVITDLRELDLPIEIADPIVEAPALQLLPLAVFV